MKYTVSMATWYGGKWHEDAATTSAPMDEQAILAEGHKLTKAGAYPMYRAEDGTLLIESNGTLEFAFTDMVA